MGQIGYFGKRRFEVSSKKIFTFTDFKRTTAGRYEVSNRIGQKPLTERTGPGLDAVTFTVSVKASFGVDPRTVLDDWASIANNGIVDVLVIGNKMVGSHKYTLKSVDETWSRIDGKGNVIEAAMDLSFEEYVEK